MQNQQNGNQISVNQSNINQNVQNSYSDINSNNSLINGYHQPVSNVISREKMG